MKVKVGLSLSVPALTTLQRLIDEDSQEFGAEIDGSINFMVGPEGILPQV